MIYHRLPCCNLLIAFIFSDYPSRLFSFPDHGIYSFVISVITDYSSWLLTPQHTLTLDYFIISFWELHFQIITQDYSYSADSILLISFVIWVIKHYCLDYLLQNKWFTTGYLAIIYCIYFFRLSFEIIFLSRPLDCLFFLAFVCLYKELQITIPNYLPRQIT